MSADAESLDFLINLSPNIFFETDINGHIRNAPAKASVFFGVRDINGMYLADLLDRNNAAFLHDRIHFVLNEKLCAHFQLNFKSRWYHFYLCPRRNVAAFCIEDITEKRQLSSILQKTQRRLEFAERTASIGYWEFDIKARKIYWSAEIYRLFGIDARRISGKRNIIKERILKEDLPLYKSKLQALLRSQTTAEGLVRLRCEQGNIVYCMFNAGIMIEEGIKKIAGTFQDITPLIETQNALRQAKEEAERANYEKSCFLAQASHDLRQPMQALKLYLAGLIEGNLDKRQLQMAEKADAAADNLRSMLDNFLDISQLEVGGLRYHPREFNIGTLMRRIAAESADLAADKHIRFHCFGRERIVLSDPHLVERMIRNLLGNAFKFTSDKVILGSRREGNRLRIMVLDNGSGVIPEEAELIFKEFYQSKRQNDRHRCGAGLGLSIVRKIAALIGNKLKLVSIPERGSCFSFTLPLVTVKPARRQRL